MDLIDRAALKKELHEAYEGEKCKPDSVMLGCTHILCDNYIACQTIEQQPTIPAVPLRRTKPVMGVSRDQLRNWWQCGNCESVIDQGDRYCRGCGAEVEWDDKQ